jgi:S-adenosylmethionine:tRNA ribosyltransferase-isomerase
VPLATDLFDYSLPDRLVAQTPASRRDQSRLLVIDRKTHSIEHARFSDIPRFLKNGDTLFRNNAAVLPARLQALRPSGGHVECFLLRKTDNPQAQIWHCLLRPGKRLPKGATFAHEGNAFSAEVIEKAGDGTALVRFTTPKNEALESVAHRVGGVPLPPYILRQDSSDMRDSDLERYQTVYADTRRHVAVAAPTAGLHFTPELLRELASASVRFQDLTLHVGLGTFKPIATDTIEGHDIHLETYEITLQAQRALFAPPGRRVAVGTTSVRTIEDFLSKHDVPSPGDVIDEASLFIYPPRHFHGVDVLITNFHQPRSTLLCLVSAFLTPGSTEGIGWLKEIYAQAISREYRFFSYGDAMLIL